MFTGIGGFELGLEGHECVGFSEIDKHCSLLLSKKYPEVKNYGDENMFYWRIPKKEKDD
jgi:site-specific DNA-cytosine methylase